MNNQILKDAIADVIKNNGTNSITGDVLQNALLSIINQFGSNRQFAGVATPQTQPGSPDMNVFYMAYIPGMYSNFNGATIRDGEIHAFFNVPEWNSAKVFSVDVSGFIKEKFEEFDLPDVNYLNKNWNTQLSTGFTYYDTRCKAPARTISVDVDVVVVGRGDLNVVFLSMSDVVLYKKNQTVEVGVNEIYVEKPGSIKQDFYVAIESVSGVIRSITPPESMTTCRSIPSGGASSSAIQYRIAYKIKYKVESLDSLGQRVLTAEEKSQSAISIAEALDKAVYGNSVQKYLPESNYLVKNWSSSLTTNYIFYDARAIVDRNSKLSKLYLNGRVAGTFDIVFISMSESILYSDTKNFSVGDNTYQISVPNTIQAPYYVGVRPLTGTIGTIIPKENLTTTRQIAPGNSASTLSGYRFPYMLELMENADSIFSRITTLEILVKSDTSSIQNQLNSKDDIRLEAKTYNIEESLIIPSGKKISGVPGKTTLQAAQNLTKIADLSSKSDTYFHGIKWKGVAANTPMTSTGISMPAPGIVDSETQAINRANIGTKSAIVVNSVERCNITGCEFSNLDSHAIIDLLSGKTFEYGIKINDNYFHDNYSALLTDNEAEYSSFMGNTMSRNQIALFMNSGNNLWVANHFDKNRVGVVVGPGTNNGHGSFSACTFNHNSLFGVITNGVSNGQVFSGCQFWYGNVLLLNSKGININGGQSGQTTFYIDGALDNGLSQILGMCFNGGSVIQNYNGHPSNISLKNNYYLSGASSAGINN